jgi:hypothetical protein
MDISVVFVYLLSVLIARCTPPLLGKGVDRVSYVRLRAPSVDESGLIAWSWHFRGPPFWLYRGRSVLMRGAI